MDNFFHIEYDWGMIGFVVVMVMLMVGFAIKYMIYMPYSVAENISELPNSSNKNTASQPQHYKSNINVDDEIKKL